MGDDDDEFSDDDVLLEAADEWQRKDSMIQAGVPALLRSSLLPFQRDGVLFGIKNDGKLLLADEMGLGKTIQAIAIASVYSADWPMLVVVPASMKYVWLDEIQRWLPHITPDSIHLVSCAEDVPNLGRCKISIVSYGLFQYKRFFTLLEMQGIQFNVIICDESHYLKNWRSLRTKHLVQLLHKAKRRILLTGTPALARPEELYTQINSIAPRTFGSYTQYCERYCQGHYNYRLKQFDVSGASNLDELHTRLTKDIMIRRMKANVLTQLPAKQRQKISFDLPAASMKLVEECKAKLNAAKETNVTDHVTRNHGNHSTLVNKLIMELYKLTGLAKIPACVGYIREMLKQGSKFLVFAHHIAMLDAIEKELISNKTGYIRIDGSVSAVQRQEFVQRFQTNDSCLVALLGIQAAGVGLTLTSASLVVFCELHWSPGVLQQAEDRVHRISQKNAVNIYYLIGLGTMDEMLWKKLNRKVDVVGKALEGRGGDMRTTETEDEALKEILASCTTSPSSSSSSASAKKRKAGKPAQDDSSLVLTTGQQKLTSFLNLSVDDDFKDTRVSGGSTKLRVDKILSMAQERTDKMRINLLERDSGKKTDRGKKTDNGRKQDRGKKRDNGKKTDRGKKTNRGNKEQKSKYFVEEETPVIVLSDDDQEEDVTEELQEEKEAARPCPKRICTREEVKVVEEGTIGDEEEIEMREDTEMVAEEEDHDEEEGDVEERKNSEKTLVEKELNISVEGENVCTGQNLIRNKTLEEDIEEDNRPNHLERSEITAITSHSSHSSSSSSDIVIATNSSEDSTNSSDVDLFTDLALDALQFSVSAHTERVYFYDYTGRYLEENCLISDITDSTSFDIPLFLANNPDNLNSARDFALHWSSISKTTKAKLYGRVIVDLESELKLLYDGRVSSTTRHTRGPTSSETATGSTVTLTRTVHLTKNNVDISQKFSSSGYPLCLSCDQVVSKLKITLPTKVTKLSQKWNSKLMTLPFQGRFCSLECSKCYGVKANSHFVRNILFDLELGVCQLCGLDTCQLIKQLKLSSSEERVALLNKTTLKNLTDKQKRNIVAKPTEGLLWQADHVIPVAEGGGECDIDNYRTLCTVCHKLETKKLLQRLKQQKSSASNKSMGIKDIRNFMG